MRTELIITTPPTLDDVMLSTAEAAKRLGYAKQTLINMRCEGRGPRFYRRANGSIRYPDWAVFDFELGKPI